MVTEVYKEERTMRKRIKVEYVFVGTAKDITHIENKLLDIARMEECVSFTGEASAKSWI